MFLYHDSTFTLLLLYLISTQVVVEAEVGVELGNFKTFAKNRLLPVSPHLKI